MLSAETVILSAVPTALIVFALAPVPFTRPFPAVICPAPENCVHVNAVDPTVMVPSVLIT